MALPGNNNSISLSQIQTEFGGEHPISLTEYYRNGTYVTSNNTSVPTTGEISMSDFFGTERMFYLTLSANTADADLQTLASTAGWTSGPITLTINAGVYVYATGANAALTVNNLDTNVIINNYGYVLGLGGRGGNANASGSPGGTGIYLGEPAVVNNYSGAFICGGGGGGAGASGWGAGGGGAGGGRGGNFTYSGGGNGGAGGGPGLKGGNGASRLGYGWGAGGEAGGQGGSGESNSGTDDAGAGGGGGRIVPGRDVRVNSGGNNNGWGAKGSGGGNAGGNGSGRGGGGGGGWGASGGNASGGSGGLGGKSLFCARNPTINNEGTIYGDVRFSLSPSKNYGTDGENQYDLDGNLA